MRALRAHDRSLRRSGGAGDRPPRPTPARGPDLFDERLSRASLLEGRGGRSASACRRCLPRRAAADRARARPRRRRPARPRRAARCGRASSAAAPPRRVNPFIGVTPIDEGRIQNLYDPLVLVNADLTAVAGPRARVERERGRHGLRGQAAPRRQVPQRQDVRRRRRHLLDPADGQAGQRRLATRSSRASTWTA